MQTVCAHCYQLLKRRQQGFGQILCTTCEHRWHRGQDPHQSGAPPQWHGNLARVVEKRLGLS